MSTIKINVNFERIIYNLNFKIDNENAGRLEVFDNLSSSGLKSSVKLENMSVGNAYSVDYYAYAGFKLQEVAFKLNGTHILQSYNENVVDPDYNISQIYNLTQNFYGDGKFDGTWLRLFFYTNEASYALANVSIGDLMINTEAMEFSFGVKIWDETDLSKEDDGFIDASDVKWD